MGKIEIYSEGNDTSPGELITSEPYYFDDIDWFRINLSTAVPIDGNSDIWIAVTWNTTDYDEPAAADDGPAVDGKGDWILLPGEDWGELQGYGLDYNWFIEGIVKENQPPYLPTNPEPEDGASDVDIDIVLSWTGGDPDGNPVTYDVYFGTTSPPSKVISNHTEETYNLGTMNYSTTYYWKIVAWDVIGAQSEGPIWEFTTRDPMPDVECDGTLSWTDVSTEETVEGSFTVKNIGEPTSLLDWEIESYPDWGTWTFNPGSGDDLKPSDGPVIVNVTVVAPDEQNQQFTGEIKIVNSENISDFCIVDASLSTLFEPELNVRGGFGVNVIIKNTGDVDANYVKWEIHVEGGVLGFINKTVNGTVDIKAGESQKVSSGMLFGLGEIDVKVTVVNEEKIATGTQIIILTIINK